MWKYILRIRKIRELKQLIKAKKEISNQSVTFDNIVISFDGDIKESIKTKVFQLLSDLNIPELMGVDPMYAWKSGIMDCHFSWNTKFDTKENPVSVSITMNTIISYESLLYYIQHLGDKK